MSNVLIGGFSATLVLADSLKRRRPSSRSFTSYLVLYFLLSPLLLCVVPAISAKLLPDIYWNSTNGIFRIDNTDHVFSVKIRDRVNIRCPTYDPKTIFDPKQVEYSEIYNVPRWGYDNCMVSLPEAKIVGVCRTPFHESVITVVFREFTPLPGGLEFTPGRSYYFISTSNGTQSGLSNRQGGLCEQKNMKLKFEVHSDDEFVDENESGNSHTDEWQQPTATDNSKWPNVKFIPPSPVIEKNANDKEDLPQQNSDTVLNSNSNSGEQIISSSQNLSRPNVELLTTTTSVWYEIHTRDPDDIYGRPKNNDFDHNYNHNKGDVDKSDGRSKGRHIDSVASNSRRMSGASQMVSMNIRHFFTVAIVSRIFSGALSSTTTIGHRQ